MSTIFDKEMMKALEEDGKKLRQLTGEDHGPYFVVDHAHCPACGGSGVEEVYGGHGNVLEIPCSLCSEIDHNA